MSEATSCSVGASQATEAPCLHELVLLEVLRQLHDDAAVLVTLRLVSRQLRDLADLVLEEAFKQRWGVTAVVTPPPSAPMYAAARPAAFVLCHRLSGRGDTLCSLALRHGTDVVELKRLNNLISDGALASRSHLYVPVPDAAAAAAGQRVAFVHDSHSKRRLIVILREGEELPAALTGSSSGGGSPRHAPGSSQAFVVAKLAKVLERALRIDSSTAAFYVQQAGCDVRAAIEKYEEDRRWEKVMKRQGPRLRL
ncbi:hypothetical protein ABPG75_012769 [Micractinium tetrahymenae]